MSQSWKSEWKIAFVNSSSFNEYLIKYTNTFEYMLKIPQRDDTDEFYQSHL